MRRQKSPALKTRLVRPPRRVMARLAASPPARPGTVLRVSRASCRPSSSVISAPQSFHLRIVKAARAAGRLIRLAEGLDREAGGPRKLHRQIAEGDGAAEGMAVAG